MGTQAVSGRFETFWQRDGLNVQPDGLKRFKTGFLRFVGTMAESTGSKRMALDGAIVRLSSQPTPPLRYAKRAPDRRSSEDGGGLCGGFCIFLNFEKNRMLN